MFDESGTDYQPRSPQKRTLPDQANTDSPPVIYARVHPPATLIKQRPLWVVLTAMFLGFMFSCRLVLVTGDDPLEIVVQLGAVGVLGLTIVGLLGMRRWGALLLLLYCVWGILSPIVTGLYRISIMDDVLTNPAHKNWMMLGEFGAMGMALIFYGLLGAWYAVNLKRFIPVVNGWPTRARISFIIMAGFLVLYTATQISDARPDLLLQEELFEERLQEFFRN